MHPGLSEAQVRKVNGEVKDAIRAHRILIVGKDARKVYAAEEHPPLHEKALFHWK